MGIKGYKHPGKKKVVVAVNPDGSVERVFDFIKDGAAYYGCDRHSITNSCRRGTVAHGFKWFYEEEFRQIYMNCEYEKLRWTPDPNRDRWTYHFKKGHKFGNGYGNLSEEQKRIRGEVARSAMKRRKERGGYEELAKKLHKPVVCLNDGKEFPSVKHASEYYGIPPNQISGAIHRVGKVRGLKIRLKSQLEGLKEVI